MKITLILLLVCVTIATTKHIYGGKRDIHSENSNESNAQALSEEDGDDNSGDSQEDEDRSIAKEYQKIAEKEIKRQEKLEKMKLKFEEEILKSLEKRQEDLLKLKEKTLKAENKHKKKEEKHLLEHGNQRPPIERHTLYNDYSSIFEVFKFLLPAPIPGRFPGKIPFPSNEHQNPVSHPGDNNSMLRPLPWEFDTNNVKGTETITSNVQESNGENPIPGKMPFPFNEHKNPVSHPGDNNSMLRPLPWEFDTDNVKGTETITSNVQETNGESQTNNGGTNTFNPNEGTNNNQNNEQETSHGVSSIAGFSGDEQNNLLGEANTIKDNKNTSNNDQFSEPNLSAGTNTHTNDTSTIVTDSTNESNSQNNGINNLISATNTNKNTTEDSTINIDQLTESSLQENGIINLPQDSNTQKDKNQNPVIDSIANNDQLTESTLQPNEINNLSTDTNTPIDKNPTEVINSTANFDQSSGSDLQNNGASLIPVIDNNSNQLTEPNSRPDGINILPTNSTGNTDQLSDSDSNLQNNGLSISLTDTNTPTDVNNFLVNDSTASSHQINEPTLQNTGINEIPIDTKAPMDEIQIEGIDSTANTEQLNDSNTQNTGINNVPKDKNSSHDSDISTNEKPNIDLVVNDDFKNTSVPNDVADTSIVDSPRTVSENVASNINVIDSTSNKEEALGESVNTNNEEIVTSQVENLSNTGATEIITPPQEDSVKENVTDNANQPLSEKNNTQTTMIEENIPIEKESDLAAEQANTLAVNVTNNDAAAENSINIPDQPTDTNMTADIASVLDTPALQEGNLATNTDSQPLEGQKNQTDSNIVQHFKYLIKPTASTADTVKSPEGNITGSTDLLQDTLNADVVDVVNQTNSV